MKEVFLEHIPDDYELDQFAAWAFGPKYADLDQSLNFMKAWNDLHGISLTLEPTGHISVDAPKMVELWKNNK